MHVWYTFPSMFLIATLWIDKVEMKKLSLKQVVTCSELETQIQRSITLY